MLEHVREDTGAIAVAHDQHARRRRALRDVHRVGHLPGLLETSDDANRLSGDRFLGLLS
jgi:hypothetical protein